MRIAIVLAMALSMSGCAHWMDGRQRGVWLLYLSDGGGVSAGSAIGQVVGEKDGRDVALLGGRGASGDLDNSLGPEITADDGLVYGYSGPAPLLVEHSISVTRTRYNTDGSSETLRVVTGTDAEESRGTVRDVSYYLAGALTSLLVGP